VIVVDVRAAHGEIPWAHPKYRLNQIRDQGFVITGFLLGFRVRVVIRAKGITLGCQSEVIVVDVRAAHGEGPRGVHLKCRHPLVDHLIRGLRIGFGVTVYD
jgi:hypothetical protein